MDFSVRGGQPVHHSSPSTSSQASVSGTAMPPVQPKTRRSDSFGGGRALRIMSVILLFSITVLLIAIAVSIYFGGDSESKLVNAGTFQAVNVSSQSSVGGTQIYFGNIKTLSARYVVLQNVYYALPGSSSSKPTVAPLSCQTGEPYDQIVINRTALNWWEDLQPKGAITTAIVNYEKANTTSQPCPKAPAISTVLGSEPTTTSTTTPAVTSTTTTTTTPTTTPSKTTTQ